MNFIFEQIRTGGDRNFGYLIGDRNAGVAVLVDPSYHPDVVVERTLHQNLKTVWIMNTHGHHDHVNGNEKAQGMTQAQIITHEASKVSHDRGVKDGQILTVGKINFLFIHTPGHAFDHMVIYLPQFKILMTGDHLFVGKIGGTQNEQDAQLQYNSLRKLCKELPDDVTIWPGHDYGCRPSSTIALEKISNPFLLTKNFEEFLKLKINWGAYKAQYGLI